MRPPIRGGLNHLVRMTGTDLPSSSGPSKVCAKKKKEVGSEDKSDINRTTCRASMRASSPSIPIAAWGVLASITCQGQDTSENS
jgi:hypothetical protein